ncbi:hypothetical protein LUZ60_016024 [Juncus effusus]|nr:hypothetical protein LUZ60_016024 [Juncus effusus]
MEEEEEDYLFLFSNPHSNQIKTLNYEATVKKNRIRKQGDSAAAELMASSSMMDGGASLPVVLMDGEERAHVGEVNLDPSQGAKKFQFDISRQIGVSPYQINSFLVRAGGHFRIQINEKTDLSVVVREGGDWYVLAVVRRPRNSSGRNRRRRSNGFVTENPKPKTPPEKIILRRRDDSGQTPMVQHLVPGPAELHVNTRNVLSVWDQYYQAQIWNLQRERQRYITETRMWTPDSGEITVKWDTWRRPEPGRAAVCGVCEAAADAGVPAGFHRCVRDEVVEVGPFFRSPVGPIERPSRRNCLDGIS